MSRTYKATGINLKSMPLGESDRLLTVLTREFGLLRVVAPGARKPRSSLGGRSDLFVVNELLISKGRSLDKINQAEILESYPRLSQDLIKLAASQYLAEMVLCQALSEQPQEELFCLLNEHLRRLERLPKTEANLVLAHLTHAVFHLLALAGITPQVQVCCLTSRPLTPDFTDPDWQVGFDVQAGGTISLLALNASLTKSKQVLPSHGEVPWTPIKKTTVAEASPSYQVVHRQEPPRVFTRLHATELALLQQLAGAELTQINAFLPNQRVSWDSWLIVEKTLRQYAQYHFGRSIRSGDLIDNYFASILTSSTNYDPTV